MKKQLITIGIIEITFMIVICGCISPSTDRTIDAYDLLYKNHNPGDIVILEDICTGIDKANNNTYGEKYQDHISVGQGEGNILLISDDSIEYKIGDKIRKTIKIKEYELNEVEFLSADEIYPLFTILLSATQIATDATSFVAGIAIICKSIDKNGNTQYEIVANTSISSKEYNVSLLKISYDEDMQTYNKKINDVVELCGIDFFTITGNLSDFEEIDKLSPLNSSFSQNGYIEYIDVNNSNSLDTGDIFNISIPPTNNQYVVETYILIISKNDFTTIDDLGEGNGFKYIVNWYNGVFSYIE